MYTIGPGVGELRLGGVKALSPPPPGNADLDWGVSGLGRIALLCCGQGDGVCLLFPVGNSSFLLNLKVLPSCFTTQVISCLTREFKRANLEERKNIKNHNTPFITFYIKQYFTICFNYLLFPTFTHTFSCFSP